MRIVVTGQVGLDKKPFLECAARIARDRGCEIALSHVGDMMYAEAPDVAPGRILDLPLSRLQSLRRSVFKDHADHTLKDLMVWREEEILATELLSQIVSGHGRFFILARGGETHEAVGSPPEMLARLVGQPETRKAYLSFPMSHVDDSPGVLAEIESFRRQMKRHFICFDPGDVEEKDLARLALAADEEGRPTVEVGPPGRRTVMETAELLSIVPDIDGQIYARDFKLIDQADMIISLIPELAGGRPGLSSGVERELQHAHEATRDVFVIWRPETDPSPFITETATRVFRTCEQAVGFFHEQRFVPPPPSGALFR
jgi:adenylate kinase